MQLDFLQMLFIEMIFKKAKGDNEENEDNINMRSSKYSFTFIFLNFISNLIRFAIQATSTVKFKPELLKTFYFYVANDK